jgi:YD repeat-containing protein
LQYSGRGLPAGGVENGNLTARGADSFAWDAADRLVSATVDSATTTFAYNGDGLRASLTFDSNTTTFTWDVNRVDTSGVGR